MASQWGENVSGLSLGAQWAQAWQTSMSPPPSDSGDDAIPPSIIDIEEDGDLVIRLYDPSETTENFTAAYSTSGDRTTTGRLIAQFRINKQVLICHSKFFADKLSAWFDSVQRVMDIELREGDKIAGWDLWFRQLHNKLNGANYKIGVVDLWAALFIAWNCNFPVSDLQDWFRTWMLCKGGNEFEHLSFMDCRQLLYPCELFNFAEGFAYVTKKMAYEFKGHITEKNPRGNYRLHLSHGIIGGINAARGHLNSHLFKRLYIVRKFLKPHKGKCHESGLWRYEKALDKTGAWPLEEALRGKDCISIDQVLARLRNFTYKPPPNVKCGACSQDYKLTVVGPAVTSTRENFDGLCLDCIDKFKSRDWDADYWRHIDPDETIWDEGCRIKHGESTHYFSWVSRRHHPDAFEGYSNDRPTQERKQIKENNDRSYQGPRGRKQIGW